MNGIKKQYFLIAGAIFLIGAVWWLLGAGGPTKISADMKIAGDYMVEKETVIENNAKLTVAGNLEVKDAISCAGGGLRIEVAGDAKIDGILRCDRGENISEGDTGVGISLVVGGSVTFGKDALVVSNGHVEVASDAGNKIKSQEDIDAIFEETGENSGDGPRVGPLVDKGGANALSPASPVFAAAPSKDGLGGFVSAANAQEPRDMNANIIPNVIIGGHWYVGDGGMPPSGVALPKPPKNVKKILVNFNFGPNGNVEFRDFFLVGPDGRDGKSDMGTNCNAHGEKGEDAFRMRVRAANVKASNFTLQLGDGGQGGGAETKKDCDPGIAFGGKGGEAGNFKITAIGQVEIVSMRIIPGRGGAGGEATALGKDGAASCGGEKGGDARANGGDGGANKKELAADGAVMGIGNIQVDTVEGGFAGSATARPGKGGDGNACGCSGGKGGTGTATGGKGGDASAKIAGGTAEAKGGNGGDAETKGGNGGNGGSCGPDKKGGNGGVGGDAKSKEGKGGAGTTANGTDGTIRDETGGDGGNGGDGCGPGKGGVGGAGDPEGKPGEKGKITCVEEKKTGTQIAPPAEETPKISPREKVSVIQYNGKYLPVDQLIIEAEKGCDGGMPHWHAARGVVKAIDGSMVPDPGPQCGYGKQSEKPVMEIEFAE